MRTKSLKQRAALMLTAGAAIVALNGATAQAAESSPLPTDAVPVAGVPGDGVAAQATCIRFYYISGQQGRRAFMENLCPNRTVYGQIVWSAGGNSARCRLLPYQRASS